MTGSLTLEQLTNPSDFRSAWWAFYEGLRRSDCTPGSKPAEGKEKPVADEGTVKAPASDSTPKSKEP